MAKKVGFLTLCTLYLGACSLQLKPNFNPFYLVVLQAQPNHAAALYGQGENLIRQGRYESALGYFESLTKAAPGEAKGWIRLGQCRYELHSFKSAKEAFKRAVELQPGQEAEFGLASATLMAGNPAEATALGERLKQKYGASAEYYHLEGDIHYLQDDWKGALTDYQQSLIMLPSQSDLQIRVKDLEEFLTADR